MADLTAVPTDAGVWLTIAESDGSELFALVHTLTERSGGVTVYWPARHAAQEFASFFETALPKVRDYEPGMRRFERRLGFVEQSGEERDLAGSTSYEKLFFLRFEHLQALRDHVERPVLIVWSNLIAGKQSNVPDDAAGVLLQPRHLSSLEQSLATLIANTSDRQPQLSSVVSMLNALGSYLSGGTEPMVAAA